MQLPHSGTIASAVIENSEIFCPRIREAKLPIAVFEAWVPVDKLNMRLSNRSAATIGSSECSGVNTGVFGHTTLVRRSILAIPQIIKWADAYRARMGRWPKGNSTECIDGTDGQETWRNINQALRCGLRGLPRGLSLARLLSRYRGVRNRKALPHLSIRQILLLPINIKSERVNGPARMFRSRC